MNETMSTLLVTSQSPSQQLETILKKVHTINGWENLSLPDADVTVINDTQEGIKIKTVRELISDASFKPYARKERLVVLLNLDQASLPAQQALLKFLEEPPSYVRIIATTANLQSILPTIQSRCTIAYVQQNDTTKIPQEVGEWITKLPKASYADIIDISAKYKDRAEAIPFLQQCLFALKNQTNFPSSLSVKTSQHILESIARIQANANVRLTMEDCFFSVKNRF